jgi:hypothetical protein
VLVARVLAWAWSPGLVLIDDGDVVGELPRRVVLREEEEVASLLPLFFICIETLFGSGWFWRWARPCWWAVTGLRGQVSQSLLPFYFPFSVLIFYFEFCFNSNLFCRILNVWILFGSL